MTPTPDGNPSKPPELAEQGGFLSERELVSVGQFVQQWCEPKLLSDLFTREELTTVDDSSSPATVHQRLAARYAAKCAALRLLELDDSNPNMRSVSVVTGDGGQPLMQFCSAAETAVAGRQVFVTLSHDGDLSGALVAIEQP